MSNRAGCSLTHLCIVVMSTKHQQALKSARCDLLKSVRMSELLLAHLISNYIITSNMKEEIEVSTKRCLDNVMVRALYQ